VTRISLWWEAWGEMEPVGIIKEDTDMVKEYCL
jgi:hypothetical protein